jgi:hypothetical protein
MRRLAEVAVSSDSPAEDGIVSFALLAMDLNRA